MANVAEWTGTVEAARRIELEWQLTRMLGLLPEQADEAAFVLPLQTILDVGCGFGTWAVELSRTHPHADVHGFDVDEAKIADATRLARAHGLSAGRFRVMSALEPLDYPSGRFDLVSARCVSLRTTAWKGVLAELYRITRPGGFLRFMETEDLGATTSPAFERLSVIFLQACRVRAISWSPTGRSMGVVPRFPSLLRDAGYTGIRTHVSLLDWSAGTPAHAAVAEDMVSAFKRVHPFMADLDLASEQELATLQRDVELEIGADDFGALWTFFTVWGEKPEHQR